MKGIKLHDALARRRHLDQERYEQTKSVEKYFDRWSNITSKFENWTTPEYYQAAERNFRNDEDNRRKAKLLLERRERLKELIHSEQEKYEKELKAKERPKSRCITTDVLKGVNELCKRTEEEKRRTELETELYKRWRAGDREESILLDSRSDNEALAKMNWLDKKIAAQIELQELEKQHKLNEIRLHEEIRKEDERLSARKAERDEEVAALKQFQDSQLQELKKREEQTERQRQDELKLQERIKQLQTELSNLETQASQRTETVRFSNKHIKLQMRNLSDTIVRDLHFHLNLLDRLSKFYESENQQITRAREQFKMQYDLEKQKQQQIEAMYDSEIKAAYLKQHDAWLKESQSREKILQHLIDNELQQISNEMDFIASRKLELAELRESHRQAINSANERIKSILSLNSVDEQQRIKSANSIGEQQRIKSAANSSALNTTRSIGETSLADLFAKSVSVASDRVDSATSSGRPRFGRKKVAWN